MGDRSAIEWTDATWNPVTGCAKVSSGCRNCYAERLFPRSYPGRAFTDVRLHENRITQPLRWRKPRRVFVNSMSDLFHEHVTDEFIAAVFAVMAARPRHTFQVLTKRPERMLNWTQWMGSTKTDGAMTPQRKMSVAFGESLIAGSMLPTNPLAAIEAAHWPLPNVWLGVSCEHQQTADARIPVLLRTPAAVRFVSAEPLLGPVDLRHLQSGDPPTEIDALAETHGAPRPRGGTCDRLDWLIVGGESGPKARPMDPAWARSIRDQCRATGVPFFMKQMSRKAGIPEDLLVREWPQERKTVSNPA